MKINVVDLVLIVLALYSIFSLSKCKCKDFSFGIKISVLIIIRCIDNIIWSLCMKERVINALINQRLLSNRMALYYFFHENYVCIILILMWIYILLKFINVVKSKIKSIANK